MKIMFLIGKKTNIGGIPRVVSLLSDNLLLIPNIEIHIVSYLDEKETGYNWNKKIKFHSLISKRQSMKTGIFKATIRLRKILTSEKIDILISCGSLFGPLGVLSTRLSKTKLIYWDHSNYFENTSHNFKIKSKNFTARFADTVVPLTKRDEINYRNHTSAKKIVQIYNPIDSKLEGLEHNYDKNSKLIISVGRLTSQKNFLGLVDVAKKVLLELPDIKWHIYGDGNEKDLIQDKINREGLTDKLILKGQSDNLYELYPNYSMMVMTSKYEGFPMTLLEGMANKLPLVCFDIPTGPDEIIIENLNGHLIQPFEYDKMADKIIELHINESKKILFSTKNNELIEQFNMKSIINQWINLFQSNLEIK
ncbi:glycosyltransferase family 4 protein [Cellulophaga sp. L1A9]|uniref:glycosyltransferase family 4 protein n=1 Tax=Cellulophaga sp. L1A9 TaxID=2686362 RepID=UPI00131C7829|nr:glycosyltransferase family 4 protein [Cellulophaga sp. L1A9]